MWRKKFPGKGPSDLRRRFLGHSHAVEELPVRLVPFALRHQAVQLVDELGLDLPAWKRRRRKGGWKKEKTIRRNQEKAVVGIMSWREAGERKEEA